MGEPMETDYAYILGWEVKSHSPEREKNQKLKLALQKRRIISEEIKKLSRYVRDIKKKSSKTKKKCFGGRLKILENDPFISLYLKVYRELCGKNTMEEIANEVLKRWNCMKRKPKNHRTKKTDPSQYGLLYGLVLQEKPNEKISRKDQNKLKMALLKNKIVSEEMARLTNFVKKMHKEKRYSTSFIKFYLDAFREMCGRSKEEEIRGEAIKRWNKAEQANAKSLDNVCKNQKRVKVRNFTKQNECRERHKHGQTKKHKSDGVKPGKKKRKCPYHTCTHPHILQCPHHLSYCV